MRAGHDPHLRARTLALVGQLEECPDLVDGEAERAGTADEGQSLEMVRPVQPITAGASRGRGQEPNALVVADRLDIAAGPLRKRPDDEAGCRGVHGILRNPENSA